MSDKTAIIGVDIGGTKIKTGVVNTFGDVYGEPIVILTGGHDNPEKIVERITCSILKVIENLQLAESDIIGIGLGVTGPLDIRKGLILECPQLPTMHNYPLRERIRKQFGLPVNMNNDANCLILGESIWGAGKDMNTVLGFTLGTGLGCALVINQKLYNGTNGMAGEIWPSPYKKGTIEDMISGNGISSTYHALSGKQNTAEEISSLAQNNDPEALKTWNIFGRNLAFALAWGINLVDPDIVILGGSISNSIDYYYSAMDLYLRKHICPVPARKTRVVRAALGDNAGFTGAAALVIHGN